MIESKTANKVNKSTHYYNDKNEESNINIAEYSHKDKSIQL